MRYLFILSFFLISCIKDDVDDSNATQVNWEEFTEKCDVVSLHTPWTKETDKMVNTATRVFKTLVAYLLFDSLSIVRNPSNFTPFF